jgi:hypothetical protein
MKKYLIVDYQKILIGQMLKNMSEDDLDLQQILFIIIEKDNGQSEKK